jgi:hypothetical protein
MHHVSTIRSNRPQEAHFILTQVLIRRASHSVSRLRLLSALAAFILFAITLSAADRVILVAGGGSNTNKSMPLIPSEARLESPFGVDFDREGNLYLVELNGYHVRRIGRDGKLVIVAGTGAQGNSGDGGPALQAQFNGMHNLAISRAGAIYLPDTWNNRVRKFDPHTHLINAWAGTGEKGYAGDGGPALQARFGGIYCVSLDPRGEELFLADLDNRRVRAVNVKSGRVRLVTGDGEKGVPMDGAQALAAPLVDPRAVIADRQGRVYILERSGNALRVVDRDGSIRTVVGKSGRVGNTGDDGPAEAATLNGPKHLCEDRDGSILIADTENHVIRRYNPTDGRLTRVAGTGQKGTNGVGGPPLQVELHQPHGVYVHPGGDLYIADSGNHRVLKVERSR